MNPLELGCQGFHEVSLSLLHTMPTLIFKIKASTSFNANIKLFELPFWFLLMQVKIQSWWMMLLRPRIL
jgi:hypothetical protein